MIVVLAAKELGDELELGDGDDVGSGDEEVQLAEVLAVFEDGLELLGEGES